MKIDIERIYNWKYMSMIKDGLEKVLHKELIQLDKEIAG